MNLLCMLGLHDWGEKFYDNSRLAFGGWNLSDLAYATYYTTCKRCGQTREGREPRASKKVEKNSSS
jgi:hypothetical protein